MDAHPRTSYRTGLLCLAVTSVGWGLNWPAIKVLLSELPPLFARGSAGVVAAAVFAVVALQRGESLRVPRATAPRLVGAALTNVFAWMGFATLAMRWLSVGQGALLVYTMPIWATLFAWPLAGQRPSRRAGLGLLLSIAGLWTLFGGSALPLDRGHLIGAGLALASASIFAFGTVAMRPLAELPPFALLAWQLGLGSLPMLILGVTLEQPHLAGVSGTGWALMLYMTAVPMGLCYLTWFAALRRLPPATASIATLMTPVIGVLAAALTLGEPLGGRELAALALTMGGVALALLGKGPAGSPRVATGEAGRTP